MAKHTPHARYSAAELDAAAIADLIADAESAERQAANAEFFPGVTFESLMVYAQECRAKVERYKSGGAHNAAIRGEG